ncbi:hypothetical protein ISN45_At01g025950 [Arabidopsis thaliana x Arabidopsis arenosa]|jgi:hypothetical protein|uniref:Uncharacterized protein n=4 Tax=Arabidopsis TaxID=3701 RepID=A0A178WCD4_ARATH|nr:hypothetical protein ISN45_At01g025950 [Arabidopsis thaliana x Arabidopsis arenosa]KAG7655497.1 hypothetical protein ISN44_As01g025730 [Arabidopsis suecica]OAP15856.1 hypothetical protein AXX17_AT1G26560 [Arabidopsis thaliana]
MERAHAIVDRNAGSSPLLAELVWSFNLREGWDGPSFVFCLSVYCSYVHYDGLEITKVESDLRITSTIKT